MSKKAKKRKVTAKYKSKAPEVIPVGIFQAPKGDPGQFIVEKEITSMGTVITYVSRKKFVEHR